MNNPSWATLAVTDTLTVENLVLETGTTTNWTVLGNATTTGWLNIGTTDVGATLGDLIGAGDLFVGNNATVTNSLDVLGHINLATTSATQGTNNFISFPTQSAAPAAPEDGRTIVYARVSDGEVSLFSRNSTTESLLGGAGGGGCTNLNCLSDVAIVSVANNEL
ncbi:hypothetical protein LCGC14_3167190, partial [marine sediment metagenome]